MNCENLEPKILEYVDGELSKAEEVSLLEHISKCKNCSDLLSLYQKQNNVLERYFEAAAETISATERPQLVEPQKVTLPKRKTSFLYAAAVIFGVFLTSSLFLYVYNHFIYNKAGKSIGVAMTVAGKVQYFNGNKLFPLEEGMAINSNTRFKTTKSSYLAIKLQRTNSGKEENIIEFKDNSAGQFLAFNDKTILSLERGEIWAHINQKMDKPLVIKTSQFSIYDKGTIFNVAEGLTGISVGVLGGKVEFENNGKKESVEKSQFFTTYEDKSDDSLQKHIRWSHYSEKLQALLPEEKPKEISTQLRVNTPQQTVQQVTQKQEAPGILENDQLMPLDTRFYLNIANSMETSNGWKSSDFNRILQDPTIMMWWGNPQMVQTRNKIINEFGFMKWLDLVNAINGAITFGVSAEGNPIFIADCRKSEEKVKEILEKEINPLIKKWKTDASSFYNPNMALELKRGYLILSWNEKELKKTLEAIENDKPTGFTDGHFYKSLEINVPKSRMTVAYDIASTVDALRAKKDESLNKFLERSGVEGLDYVLGSPDFAGRGINQAFRVAFTNERFGVLSWIDDPSPMGSLFCFAPDTHLLIAAKIKNPTDMFDDIMAWMYEDGGDKYVMNPADKVKIQMIQDFASCFGNEVAIGLENPILPIPNVQVAIEIIDVNKFDELMTKVIDPLIKLETVTYRDIPIVTLSRAGWKFDVSYAILGDFLVLGPGEPFLRHTVDIYVDKHSIMDEYAFKSLLPETGQPNFSILFYQNISRCASWLVSNYYMAKMPTQAQSLFPDLSMLKNYSAPGIGYVLSTDKFIDLYINGSKGIDLVNISEAMPLISSLVVPKLFSNDVSSKITTAKGRLDATAAALEGYHIDKKYYPLTLDYLLSPVKYLTEIPEDPFAIQDTSNGGIIPIKYKVDTKKDIYELYSIGPDGKDDSGDIMYDPTNGVQSEGDIVYKSQKNN